MSTDAGPDGVDHGVDETPGRGVRPFVLTHGRTRPLTDDLRVETVLVAQVVAEQVRGGPERRRIVELCATPTSVAELSARLRVPIGVTTVLVADLVSDGAVAVWNDRAPVDRATLERILDRVSAL